MIKQTASRWILTSLAALVMTAGATLGATAASSVSLPGDLLYNVKRAAEQVELASAPTTQTRAQLEWQLSQRRREEVRALVSQERAAIVEFGGILQAANGQTWVIDDVQVTLDPAASVIGNPVIGQRVFVQARTLPNGQVRVFRVEAGPAADDGTPKGSSLAGLEFESPLPSPSPEASKTPEPSETPEVSETPEPSKTPEPAEHETPEASETPEAHQTLEPNHTPEPTHVPEVHMPEPAHSSELHTPEPQHTPEATDSHSNDGKTDNGGDHGGSSGNRGEKDSGGSSGDHGGND